jgi:hypothetical protein
MVERKSGRSRRQRSSAADEELHRLLAARDKLDADKVERKRLENEALEQYAAASARRKSIEAEVARKVEALQREIAQVQLHGRRQDDEVDAQQAQVVAALSRLGRSAEDLGRVFGLAPKRIRRMIRDADAATSTRRSSAAEPKPHAEPHTERLDDPAPPSGTPVAPPQAWPPVPVDDPATGGTDDAAVQSSPAS